MTRYKRIDTSPRFIAVDLERQLLPGTFEHALNHLLGHELDLTSFDARYQNDLTGASAYPPGMLLKVVLFAYSQGIINSRGIERACREHRGQSKHSFQNRLTCSARRPQKSALVGRQGNTKRMLTLTPEIYPDPGDLSYCILQAALIENLRQAKCRRFMAI